MNVPNLGFHDTCYRRFTDSKRLNAARKRKLYEDSPSEAAVSSPKKLRARSRFSSMSSGRSSSSGVLPVKCIICSRVELYITRHGKRVKDKLLQAETSDGGKLHCNYQRHVNSGNSCWNLACSVVMLCMSLFRFDFSHPEKQFLTQLKFCVMTLFFFVKVLYK